MSAKPHAVAAELAWQWRRFDRLRLRQLQGIFALRQRVFGIEQACLFMDIDGCDECAWHLAAWREGEGEPVAYARLLDPGVKYDEPSLGRVVTAETVRGSGLGRELVRRALNRAQSTWPEHGVRISAQRRLERFYAGFGFVAAGAPYVEDGIEHVEMLRPRAITAARPLRQK